MATTPYFVISPTTLVSLFGLAHGPDKTIPRPVEDWRKAVVDVVIPALNEEQHVVLCLQSIARQTMRPRQVILVDDGSRDHTSEYAKRFSSQIGLKLTVIQRRESIGKTPTVKREARELDSDVELILDGDTVLVSENYIERVVQELFMGVGIASVCGVVLPLRVRDRAAIMKTPAVKEFLQKNRDIDLRPRVGLYHRAQRFVTNLYRDVLYTYLQRFLYHGQMVFFGTIVNPVGCAVAYRRKYVEDLFDEYEPVLGDDLTNSEDIFIGFSFLNHGYRNVQLRDVLARSLEPEASHLPRQIYLWSSSFLQSCYYFDDLVRSPIKGLKRWWNRKVEKHDRKAEVLQDRRMASESYRQPFGALHTRENGRPMGWILFAALAEKIFFPTALLVMLVLQLWEPLWITLAAETALSLGILLTVTRESRFEMLVKGLLVTPLRYGSLLFDLVTIGRFAIDLWVTRTRRWRK